MRPSILERLLEVDADESIRARLDALLGKRRAEDELEQCLAGAQVVGASGRGRVEREPGLGHAQGGFDLDAGSAAQGGQNR
ncbi:MAG: hypothetical protein AABZ30_04340 [Myxococcota bacterium]